jgi:hypothetical protein
VQKRQQEQKQDQVSADADEHGLEKASYGARFSVFSIRVHGFLIF